MPIGGPVVQWSKASPTPTHGIVQVASWVRLLTVGWIGSPPIPCPRLHKTCFKPDAMHCICPANRFQVDFCDVYKTCASDPGASMQYGQLPNLQ